MFNKGNRAGGGSGVIIDSDGYGLSNFHVVAAMLSEHVGEGGLNDGKVYPLDVLGIDPTGDVAMFRLKRTEPFAFAELGDSDALEVGDYTLAMGNPFLLAEDYTPTVTLGIISGLHRYQWGSGRALRYTDCIQVDTSINPGNSGGPLFDMNGRVVGINGRVSIEERGRVNVGVGYAISINQIKLFIPALRAGLPVKHATAGFTVTDREAGVIVNQILDDSDAYKRGLRLGDVIVRFGGKDITHSNQFTSLLGIYPGGWPVDIVYKRGDKTEQLRTRLEDLPFPKVPKNPMPGAPATPDPYAPSKVTDAANVRAVERALGRFVDSVGSASAVAAIRTLKSRGQRRLAKGEDTPRAMDMNETRPEDADPRTGNDPVALEREIRWSLLAAAKKLSPKGYRVISGDEVRGRITVVLERSVNGVTYRCAFDDENGRLLRIEFRDGATNQDVRYEYGNFRRAGGLKLPHQRWLYLNDELYAEDTFEEVTGSSQTS